MKKLNHIVLTALFILSSTLLISGQAADKETRNLKGFTKVSFGVPGNLYVHIGPEFRVELEADKELLSEIETEVSDGRLVIKKDNFTVFNWTGFNNSKVIVNITMPSLEGLGVSGSGQAEVLDALKAGSLKLSVSGSGRLYLNDVNAESVDCSISGSGDVIVKGSGSSEKADISISGSGSYTGESYKLDAAVIHISGSGNCLCNVTGTLEAHVSGSGNVTYSGNPRVDARVSGSGRVRSK